MILDLNLLPASFSHDHQVVHDAIECRQLDDLLRFDQLALYKVIWVVEVADQRVGSQSKISDLVKVFLRRSAV